jgi:hypothetical protein
MTPYVHNTGPNADFWLQPAGLGFESLSRCTFCYSARALYAVSNEATQGNANPLTDKNANREQSTEKS